MLRKYVTSRWVQGGAAIAFSSIIWCAPHAASAQPLVNGSFETGDFTGWTQNAFDNLLGEGAGYPAFSSFMATQMSGLSSAATDTNAVINSQTTAFDGLGEPGPAIGPTDGNYLAFVSNETSAGDQTLSGSSISQTFTVPVGAQTLSMNVRLLNNDNVPFLTPNYNDFGGVALTQGNQILDEDDLTVLPYTGSIDVTSGANAGGFRNSTPWETVDFNVLPLWGEDVTLTAYAANVGDNHVETRLLIDNIALSEPTSSIPEPASACVMGLGGLIALMRRRR